VTDWVGGLNLHSARGIIERVPVAEARRRLAPACGESWEEATADRLSGRFSAATVEALVDEYRRDGGFEAPVLWVSDDEDGVDRVLDGMHRMVAASLVNGVVDLHEGWLTDRRAPDMVHVTFDLVLPHADDAEAIDVVFDLLRSFRLPGGSWVTADVMRGQGSMFEATWYCPAASAGKLARELIERTRRAGGRLRPTAVGIELADSQHTAVPVAGRG
jgi:hypothetical protein